MTKFKRILNGERVVCSDTEMDEFPFNPNLVSIPNPKRIGILDQWVAYLKKKESK